MVVSQHSGVERTISELWCGSGCESWCDTHCLSQA